MIESGFKAAGDLLSAALASSFWLGSGSAIRSNKSCNSSVNMRGAAHRHTQMVHARRCSEVDVLSCVLKSPSAAAEAEGEKMDGVRGTAEAGVRAAAAGVRAAADGVWATEDGVRAAADMTPPTDLRCDRTEGQDA